MILLLSGLGGHMQVWAQPTDWRISPEYTVAFSGTGATGSLRGLSGTIVFGPSQLGQSKFDVTLDPNTINTGNKTKDKHARGESWFHTARFPTIRFVSTNISRSQQGFVAKGNLALHGRKLPISIPFTFTIQQGKGVFEGAFVLNRKDFGIMGPLFGFMVGETFEVKVRVVVVR